jgi:hypothetical protein
MLLLLGVDTRLCTKGKSPVAEDSPFHTRRRLFLIPRTLADAKARRDKPLSKTENERYWRIDEVSKIFAKFENNFTLQEIPRGWR